MSRPGPLVIDAGALIAFLDKEPGAMAMAEMFVSDPAWHMHALNVCEVLYHYRRSLGERGIELAMDRIERSGITVHEDMDPEFLFDVACIKADYARVSLADCCLLAQARRISGTAVSTDRRELEPLVSENLCPIIFIR